MADWSGVGRYTAGLARELAARDDIELVQAIGRGQLPPVAAVGADTADDERRATASAIVAEGHPFGPLGAFSLSRAIAAVRPDVTHCAHFPTPLPASHPLAVTIHDLTPEVMPEVMPSGLRRAVWRYWNRRAATVADVILANSRNTATDLERLLPASVDKTRVVAHALDDALVHGPVGELPEAVATTVAGGSRYVLSMGNTKPNKDLPTLLRAFAPLAPEHPHLRLWLVGRDEPGFVSSILGDDPARERIAFTGRVNDGELRALYTNASVFAFPSRYEGFGLPPLEAMAFGAPVVCARAASLPEVVGDGALLFAPGDPAALAEALTRVLGDDALSRDLAERGTQRAAAFTWAATAAATVAAYREVARRD
jgi:glycosyltransferase involved in cell wall biosynthesis